MEDDELKPCPFCGSKDIQIHDWASAQILPFVACDECGAAGPSDRDALEAQELWNLRAELEMVRYRRVKLTEMLE